jgi:hypothetical protein
METRGVIGIPPERVAAVYRERRLGEVSDLELFRACVPLLAEPKREATSFTLHAPLEVMARYRLLPLLAPADRDLARMQMLAIVAKYQACGENLPPPAQTITFNTDEAEAELRKAASEGDVERADAICTGLADEYGVKVLLRSIADLALETLTAATHTHIGLMHIARIWSEAGPVATQLARTGLLAMAQEPVARLKPVSKRRVLKDPEGDLESILSQVPAQPPSVKGIRAVLEDAEKAGLIEELLGDSLLSNRDPAMCKAASRVACRIAALSMLGDSPEFPASLATFPCQAAKFIWTHCLTMPQAAWMLTQFVPQPEFAAQAAHVGAAWVIGLRYCYGNGVLELRPSFEAPHSDFAAALAESPRAAAATAWAVGREERPELVRILARESAIRSDAHLVKYVLACLDAAEQSPTDERLFHAAAAYLCSIWCREQSQEQVVRQLTAAGG